MPIPNLILVLAPLAAASDPGEPAPALSLQDKPVMHEWVGSVNAAAIFTDGNTETRSANAAADAQYRREKDRTTLGAFWNYQDDSTGVLQRRTGAKAQYDYFFTEKMYGFVQTSIENDKQADLARRWILSAGLGRQFVENAVHKVSAELGLSWFDEHFNNSTDHDFFAARGAYKWDWIINKAWTFFHGAEIYPSLEDTEDVYAKVDTRLKVILSEKMFAQGQWVMDWDNSPATGKESVDNRYIVSIGWSF
jgi:putative salt-induced outer membrane protein YdiY